ncbi:MAG: hypothetical protein IJ360_01065 [Clostridia bacterium]|nr:hypothetical protein [Clostridia bacterium]
MDFLIGVAASIVASIICGLFSKKVFGKKADVLTSIYSIYISFSTFVFGILLTFLLSNNIQDLFLKWSGEDAFTMVKYLSSLFWILFVNVTVITIVFLIVRQMEISQKSIDKSNKNIMDYYISQEKGDDNK